MSASAGPAAAPPRVAFFVFSAERNTLGRAFALWLTAEALGWESRFVAPDPGSPWPPLTGEHAFLAGLTADAEGAARWADALVSLKPWPGAFDVALDLGKRHHKPVVLDVDDPDFEGTFGENWRRQAVSFAQRTRERQPPLHAYRLRQRARMLDRVLLSNPTLTRWYHRGEIVPHARKPRPAGRRHTDGEIEVGFVGTVTDHKGIDVIRQAALDTGGVRLIITAPAPGDARPSERWIGGTTLAEGLDVIDQCDVVAIASRPWTYGAGQLPVKLIDAMMAGRAVVASDLGPIRWALDGSGLLVAPGDVAALSAALGRLRSADLRAELGARARKRAMSMFTPDAVAPHLAAGVGL
jgi:glycosyltransferase involved in cell wall biosynthesis